MRLKKYIKEEYWKMVKNQSISYKSTTSFPIFINPSRKESREIHSKDSMGESRFLIDNRTESVYMWNTLKMIHAEFFRKVLKRTGFKMSISKIEIIPGRSKMKNGKPVMINSDWIDYIIDKQWTVDDMETSKKKFKWANKYVEIDSFFDYIIVKLKRLGDI